MNKHHAATPYTLLPSHPLPADSQTHPVPNNLNIYSSLKVTDQVSHTNATAKPRSGW